MVRGPGEQGLADGTWKTSRALVALVGERQQRLLREIEKLALSYGRGARAGPGEAIEEMVAPSAERRAWSLADSLLSGDGQVAAASYLALRAQGERLGGLIYWMAQRVRTAPERGSGAGAEASRVSQVKRGCGCLPGRPTG